MFFSVLSGTSPSAFDILLKSLLGLHWPEFLDWRPWDALEVGTLFFADFGFVLFLWHRVGNGGSWYRMVFPQGLGSQCSNRSSGSAGGCDLTPDFGGIILWGWAYLIFWYILEFWAYIGVLSMFWGHLVSSLVGTAVVVAGILCLWLWRLGAPWPV